MGSGIPPGTPAADCMCCCIYSGVNGCACDFGCCFCGPTYVQMYPAYGGMGGGYGGGYGGGGFGGGGNVMAGAMVGGMMGGMMGAEMAEDF